MRNKGLPQENSAIDRFGRMKMEAWQAFFLGIMVAYTPTLVLFSVLLRTAPKA
jgi:hypothetical protein